MAQGELVNVENNEKGTLLTFDIVGGGKFSYIYNGTLTTEELERLKGTHLSFNEVKEDQISSVNKAWNKEGKVIFSKIPFDGDDRGEN